MKKVRLLPKQVLHGVGIAPLVSFVPLLVCLTWLAATSAEDAVAVKETAESAKSSAVKELPLVYRDDFEGKDRSAWVPTKDDVWETKAVTRDKTKTKAYRVTGKSKYQPPVRSPHSISWLKDKYVGDFVLTVKAENTNYKAGGHRDLCLFWGRQDASHFYYVHFGAKADPHSCQIFIVDGKPRTKITVDEVKGTPWGPEGEWHTLRVTHNVKDGMIRVFFDDMEKPHMTAKDETFKWGQVGIGTFDDNGNFDDFELRGVVVKPTKRASEKEAAKKVAPEKPSK